jgi:hypothetical protein
MMTRRRARIDKVATWARFEHQQSLDRRKQELCDRQGIKLWRFSGNDAHLKMLEPRPRMLAEQFGKRTTDPRIKLQARTIDWSIPAATYLWNSWQALVRAEDRPNRPKRKAVPKKYRLRN